MTPHSPASRESDPVPDAMREAAIRLAYSDHAYTQDHAAAVEDAEEFLAGPIAKELDALRARAEEAEAGRDDAERRVTNLANALTSAHRARGEQENRADEADDRRVTLEKDRIHPAFSVEVQEHRQQAYESGWSDGYAEGLAKAEATYRAAQRSQDEEIAALKRVMMIQARELKRLDPHGETPADLEVAMSALRRALAKPEPADA